MDTFGSLAPGEKVLIHNGKKLLKKPVTLTHFVLFHTNRYWHVKERSYAIKESYLRKINQK